MGIPKPLASLSSGLLARKGQARPAMRPQGFSLTGLAQAGDQLGWNDMGDPAPVPPVLATRAALVESLTPEPVVEAVAPEPVAAPPTPVVLPAPVNAKVKAAFTLRLDAERHLRLRLACAAEGRSAQQLVTRALDTFLASMPVVDQLARQLDPDAK